jgi:putative ABC transport system substrate-binding protein
MPVIGYLTAGKFMEGEPAGFQQGLKETGLVEGRDFGIEYRSTRSQSDRLSAVVADVVSRRVTVIVAVSDPYALAAKAATTAIPIVFVGGNDAPTVLKLCWFVAIQWTALRLTAPAAAVPTR